MGEREARLLAMTGAEVSRCCERTGDPGTEIWARLEDVDSKSMVMFEGSGNGARVKFEDNGSGVRTRFESGLGVRFECAWSGERIGFESIGRVSGAGIVAVPASGDDLGDGLLVTLALSVLDRLRDSRIWLLEVLAIGVLGLCVHFGTGEVMRSSLGSQMPIITVEGNFVSTRVGLEGVSGLLELIFGLVGTRSSCCITGDAVPIVRTISELEEGKGWGEVTLVITATVTVSGTAGSITRLTSEGSASTVLSVPDGVSSASKQEAAAEMVSRVGSRASGATSLGVEAWLVSVS